MLDFSPDILLDADWPIPTHALVAIAIAVLGLWQVVARKGTTRHRIAGWMFVIGMAYVALSGLFISDLQTWGYSSPIHLLIPVTLAALWTGVHRARSGQIKAHARSMTLLFALAIVVTGGFTLVPGRIMHATVFGAEAGE